MKTIKNLNEIRSMETKLYVRWSNSIVKDQKRGYSLRCGSQPEAGLSACTIDPEWEDWRMLRKLTEYQFVGASHCWIVTGTEAGTGSDGETLLIEVELVGEVSAELLTRDWQRMQLESYIASDTDRLARVTDAIARRLYEQSLAKWQDQLRRHLAGEKFLVGY